MNILRGIPLQKMPVRDLRATIAEMSRNGSDDRVSTWPKQKCIDWLTHHGVRDEDVGNLCRILLRIVIGKNEDGFPVGLRYADMAKIALRHFPNSAVTARHFSWYATTMRAAGETVPVYRE